ncbi:hypothetical protein NHF45_10375 [Maricaulaceae bacterium NA33B04]|nr:hypothetical protein [Maricaulaceae bacterium NA33B04]
MIQLLRSSALFDAARYLRSPALIYVALATPVAAYYMVPHDDANYAILTVNGFSPTLTSSVLGLQLGVIAALLLTPLAYIFLKAGPTRTRPWQISDVAPHSRMIWALGRWVSDCFILMVLLAFLTVAGLILGAFRLGMQFNPIPMIVALWLPAAPAMALVAGLRMVLDARNLTRNWFGDVIFFLVWLALIIGSTVGLGKTAETAMSSNAFADAYGFSAPIIAAVDGPVEQIFIIGPTAGESLSVDAWAGITGPAYLASRSLWLGMAAGLALLAGLIWGPRTAKARTPAATASGARESVLSVAFKAPEGAGKARPNLLAVILAELGQVFRSLFWLAVLAIAAVAGAVFDFRTEAGPVILLALIFPLTEASARWQSRTLSPWLATLGPGPGQRIGARWTAYTLVVVLAFGPALGRMLAENNLVWLPHLGIIVVVLPALIVATGQITRGAIAGRLLLLIGWYIYLSSA